MPCRRRAGCSRVWFSALPSDASRPRGTYSEVPKSPIIAAPYPHQTRMAAPSANCAPGDSAAGHKLTAALNIADLRREYQRASLSETDVDPDPLRQFGSWLQQAIAAKLPEPTAMTLATVGGDGTPAARIVLLKGADAAGFVFFT